MSKVFTPIGDKELLSKKVSVIIEEAIKTRKFQAGEKLPSEFELCDQFGVSRTSIREALRILSAKGLIVIYKGKGIFVKNITSDHILDPINAFLQMKTNGNPIRELVAARKMIEPAIAEYAAKNRTKEDIQTLKKDFADLENVNGDYSELARIDLRFHLNIAKATHNDLMPLLIEPIHKLLPIVGSYVYATVGDAKKSALQWHKKILDAVIKGEPSKAYSAMKEHMHNAEKHAELVIKKHSDK